MSLYSLCTCFRQWVMRSVDTAVTWPMSSSSTTTVVCCPPAEKTRLYSSGRWSTRPPPPARAPSSRLSVTWRHGHLSGHAHTVLLHSAGACGVPAGFVRNISGGFPGISRTLCGVFSMTFVRRESVLVLTRSTLRLWHVVMEHCTNYYVILCLNIHTSMFSFL